MKITAVDSFVIDVAQKQPIAPYQSRYIATSRTGALLVRLETDKNITGWGEAPQKLPLNAPLLDGGAPFTGQEAVDLRPRLLGRDPTAIESMYVDWDLDGHYVQSAVEMALWDILGKVCGQPLYRLLGGPYRDEVELACCMGIRPAAEAARMARDYMAAGFATLKTKAGRDPQEDLAMVRAIRDAVGDALRLRIDPNMGYSPDVCLQLAHDLEPYKLEYLEQPMPAELLEDSARIRQLTKTPLALNESVTSLERVRKILELEAADFLLPDTYQCGGIRAVRIIADIAASAGVRCVLHCAHDFGLKTAAMLHLAASGANFPLANDCTYYGLVDDILVEPHQIRRGRMRVPPGPGLGVAIDPDKLRKYCVGSSTPP